MIVIGWPAAIALLAVAVILNAWAVVAAILVTGILAIGFLVLAVRITQDPREHYVRERPRPRFESRTTYPTRTGPVVIRQSRPDTVRLYPARELLGRRGNSGNPSGRPEIQG